MHPSSRSNINMNKKLTCAYMNVRSLNNKTEYIKNIAIDNDLDCLLLTETWLSNNSVRNEQILGELIPESYKFMHIPRPRGRGGGVGVLYKESLRLKNTTCEAKQFSSMEYLECTTKANSKLIRFLVIYRPPPTSTNNASNSKFIKDFATLLSGYLTTPGSLFVCGDINLHMDIQEDRNVKKLNDVLSDLGLVQHITEPTHKAGHMLDIVLDKDTDNVVEDVNVVDVALSDHFLITFSLKLDRPSYEAQHTISYRSMNSIPIEQFRAELDSNIHQSDSVEDILMKY